ncbi:FHIPEP family protein [Anopheles sinensis]|uniref:FHIPEP family protein n=1 Tax=Anopheles sinensis TaxID=74873 RepID=A0A084WUU9_ANOSI|nr:FHIPEP family protein [Anopheles sinensis]
MQRGQGRWGGGFCILSVPKRHTNQLVTNSQHCIYYACRFHFPFPAVWFWSGTIMVEKHPAAASQIARSTRRRRIEASDSSSAQLETSRQHLRTLSSAGSQTWKTPDFPSTHLLRGFTTIVAGVQARLLANFLRQQLDTPPSGSRRDNCKVKTLPSVLGRWTEQVRQMSFGRLFEANSARVFRYKQGVSWHHTIYLMVYRRSE